MKIRKIAIYNEETLIEGFKEAVRPVRIAAAMAVITNPYAGKFQENLEPLIEAYSEDLGRVLTEKAIHSLGISGEEVESFGKGALVGIDGEVEHGSAIIHTMTFGTPVRTLCGDAETLLPAAEKRGSAGAAIDIPLKHKMDDRIRSHHMTFEVRIPDAPRNDEIVIIVAVTDSGRAHARIGNLKNEI